MSTSVRLLAIYLLCFCHQCAFGEDGVWSQRGFDSFSQGTFGNGGQNLYVSRAGVLQRIYQFDLNHDGSLDLVFCNSHGKDEQPSIFVYPEPLKDPQKRVKLISDGAVGGDVADLNADGFDDLILAQADNGIRSDLNSYIYFGSPEGFSERRLILLPAPKCASAAAGDFNADGRLDVAFLLESKVRVFYQNELGFERNGFKDLAISGMELAADRLASNEASDLVVRTESGDIDVYWGGTNGLSESATAHLDALGPAPPPPAKVGLGTYPELRYEALPVVKVIRLGKTPYLFAADRDRVNLVPVTRSRSFGKPIRLNCPKALSIAAGDINGDGHQDLAVACRDHYSDRKYIATELSWVYWGAKNGEYSESNRTPLETHRACDVAIVDLDGDGCDEVVLCQYYTEDSYSSTSRIYRGSHSGRFSAPVELASDDARRVLVALDRGSKTPQLAFVNRMAGDRLGNPDALIYWGDGKGFDAQRRSGLAAWGAIESIQGDLNDDGLADLVIANGAEDSISKDPGSYVYLNRPDGLTNEPTLRLPTARACAVTSGDINHDGFLDLLFVGYTNPEMLVFMGNGPGSWDVDHPQRILLEFDGKVQAEPRWIYLADLNDDSWLDLVVPFIDRDRSVVLWGSADGFSTQRSQSLPVFQAACAHAADFLGTGRLDLVFGGYNTATGTPLSSFAHLFWNGPNGLRQDHSTQLPAASACCMAIADFNNDHTLDLFVGAYHAGPERDTDSFIYWNREPRGFSARDRERLFTHSASGAVAADFNEDGWNDLALAYHKVEGDHRGWSAVWWNGPDGFDQRRITKLPTTGPHGMTCVSPNNQRDRGPEEYFESSAYELPDNARPRFIDWKAEMPNKTWLKAQLRTAESRENLASAPWCGAKGTGSWFSEPQAIESISTGRWIQYRLALGAINGVTSPRVHEVSVRYVFQ
ncbi:MAG: VCBS repeat-containing protein [Pirellulales bacterium]